MSSISSCRIAIVYLLLACSCCVVSSRNNAPAAGLVIKNAKVVTIDKENPRAAAIAFKGERIIAVTSDEGIEKYIVTVHRNRG